MLGRLRQASRATVQLCNWAHCATLRSNSDGLYAVETGSFGGQTVASQIALSGPTNGSGESPVSGLSLEIRL